MGEHPPVSSPREASRGQGAACGQARRVRYLGVGEVICTGASQAMTHLQIRDPGARLLLMLSMAFLGCKGRTAGPRCCCPGAGLWAAGGR